MYAKLIDGNIFTYPYTKDRLLYDYPNTSFTHTPSAADLEPFGVVIVDPVARPTVDHTKTVFEGTPVLEQGYWRQVWEITDATQSEIENRTDAMKTSVRKHRNSLLAESDWTQVTDTTVDKAVWATYRQALRDVSAQSGFPFEIQWPIKPE